MKHKFKTIEEICSIVDLIIEKKAGKNVHKSLCMDLNCIDYYNVEYTDMVKLCDKILLMAKTRNRIIRHIEDDFWKTIIDLPFNFIILSDFEVDENEELLLGEDYSNKHKKILLLILELSIQVLNLKNEETKSCDERRSNALKTISELLDYYVIKDARALLLKSIESKGNKEQYAALEALANYYDLSESELDKQLIEKLNTIIDETDDQNTAMSCLEILVNTGVIDEMEAMNRMDNWKDEYWGREGEDEEE